MKAAIYGYGNLGRGVETAIQNDKDFDLVGIFTRRPLSEVKSRTGAPVYSANDVLLFKEKLDILIICGGSASDLPKMTPFLAEHFNVVDSFDTHASIPSHFEKVDASACAGGRVALISAGWDPGLFSLARLYFSSFLPNGKTYTFWGRGVSQGHSDAIRRIDGVLDARQYTLPVTSALDAVRSGKCPTLTAKDLHSRECFVVAKEGADRKRIAETITNMPNYFAGYDTSVHFIAQDELDREHSGMAHAGCVIRSGQSAEQSAGLLELSLRLDSNPEFTAGILLACARAVDRMAKRGERGCRTMLDLSPRDLSPLPFSELLASVL